MELFSFGFSGPEMAVLVLVLVFFVGPKRLREASRALARALAWARAMSAKARAASAAELRATPLAGLGFQAVDPALLDPRRMIREAVREEMAAWAAEMREATQDPPAPEESRTAPVSSAPPSAKGTP